jgi:S-layer homology domain
MKKKSLSQSAFFNPRAVIGLFVCLAGVLIAFLAFGLEPTAPLAKDVRFGNTMTRQQMVGLYEALAPADFVPPACVAGSEMFTDVPASNPFCPWIEELSRRGITGGCAPGLFCPGDPVTRQQMAVFLVKAQFPSSVPAGVTITGHFAASGVADGAFGIERAEGAISFSVPFAAAPTPHIIGPGGAPTAECPGSFANPQAASGQLCLYESQRINVTAGTECVYTGLSGCNVATQFGGILFVPPAAAGRFFIEGTWAATGQ